MWLPCRLKHWVPQEVPQRRVRTTDMDVRRAAEGPELLVVTAEPVGLTARDFSTRQGELLHRQLPGAGQGQQLQAQRALGGHG